MERAFEPDYRVTVDQYHAFTDGRPDDERWELIDGEMVLNAMPTNWHQMIVNNVQFELEKQRRKTGAAWHVIPGIGVQQPHDDTYEPTPDVMILPRLSSEPVRWTHDILVAFEVLSPWSLRRDMVTKRAFYTRLAPLTHYVVLAQDAMRAHVFARADDFEERELTDPEAVIDFPALGASLRLRDVYRDVEV